MEQSPRNDLFKQVETVQCSLNPATSVTRIHSTPSHLIYLRAISKLLTAYAQICYQHTVTNNTVQRGLCSRWFMTLILTAITITKHNQHSLFTKTVQLLKLFYTRQYTLHFLACHLSHAHTSSAGVELSTTRPAVPHQWTRSGPGPVTARTGWYHQLATYQCPTSSVLFTTLLRINDQSRIHSHCHYTRSIHCMTVASLNPILILSLLLYYIITSLLANLLCFSVFWSIIMQFSILQIVLFISC